MRTCGTLSPSLVLRRTERVVLLFLNLIYSGAGTTMWSRQVSYSVLSPSTAPTSLAADSKHKHPIGGF